MIICMNVCVLVNALYNPDREGYLYKLSTGRVRGWKRRWVVLTEKVKDICWSDSLNYVIDIILL